MIKLLTSIREQLIKRYREGDTTIPHNICFNASRLYESKKEYNDLNDHIEQSLTAGYLCSEVGILLGTEHPEYDNLVWEYGAPFAGFVRIRWIEDMIKATEASQPLPPFYTREQLLDLYDEFLKGN